jgi:hypothetical protein
MRVGSNPMTPTAQVVFGDRTLEDPAFERHYRIGELAGVWKLGRETVRLLVKDEPGVIKIRLGRKRAHAIYSVPESVAVRIHTRLLNSR